MAGMSLQEETNAMRLSKIPFDKFVRANLIKRGRYWFVDVTLENEKPLTTFRYSMKSEAEHFLDMIAHELDNRRMTQEEQEVINELMEEAASSNESNVLVLGLMIAMLFSIILGMIFI